MKATMTQITSCASGRVDKVKKVKLTRLQTCNVMLTIEWLVLTAERGSGPL